MKNKWLSWLSSVPLLLLLPYLSVIFMQNTETALNIRTFHIEEILPIAIEQQISTGYEPETLKSQAVIARTNLYQHLSVQKDLMRGIFTFMEREGITGERRNTWYQNLKLAIFSKKSQEAAVETEGKVLQYKGKWKRLPYHEISNGKTRNGEEVFHNSDYTYLEAVESKADLDAENFLSSTCIPIKQMPDALEILDRDSSGYVLCLSANGRPIEGEAFREGMYLASTDFTIQKMGEQYCFWCKGKGHGLGLSQYGANALAKEGKTYEFILHTYFPKLELCEIEGKNSEVEK